MRNDWQPTADLATLRRRAAVMQRIREFFSSRGVLEVETPSLSRSAATDVHIESLATRVAGFDAPFYLHTSPEFPMKRLLAAGSGDIFQLCRVYRDAEFGRLHNPEFTLLEWYRIGYDEHRLMDEVHDLMSFALDGHCELASPERLTWSEAFARHAGVDPFAADAADSLYSCLDRAGVGVPADSDTDALTDLVLAEVVAPQLGAGRVSFVYDYPASQAALACVHDTTDGPRARRFEGFVDGVELCNGFFELCDAREQSARFMRDRQARQAAGLTVPPADGNLIDALRAGVPDCAGVALGIDRLLMLATGAPQLRDVIAFPIDRA